MELLQALSKWLPLLILLVQALFGWVLWSLDRRFPTRDYCTTQRQADGALIADLRMAVRSAESRHAQLRARLRALPPADAVHALERQISDVQGDVRALGAAIDGLRDSLGQVDRMLRMLTESHLRGEA